MSKIEKIYYVLALLCVLLGALLRFVFTAVRFTGFLLWCAAGALAVYALLSRWSKSRRWALWCRRALLVLLAAGFAFFAVLEAWVLSWSRTDRETPVEAVVVLGAGVNGTAPSLSLLTRLEAALDYIQDKPDVPIIVTGSQGPGEAVSEARCMADWLTARGVASSRILLDEQADNTEENVRYAKTLLAQAGVGDRAAVAVVTSGYHLCRASWLWGEGMVPVAAGMPVPYFPLTVNYYIREAFALAAALFGL
ncbi:MAG: YdcF family protein [Oscillospiraceae bacterium]|nr:YdcF family protein [Oscillospiraceae bacterium]